MGGGDPCKVPREVNLFRVEEDTDKLLPFGPRFIECLHLVVTIEYDRNLWK